MTTPQPIPVRSGFTLVELLIALAAGSVIVLTAMAGFRVALQTVSVSNRYAVENMMLRSGMEIALEEVDFWKAVDDPDQPDRQSMRGCLGSGAGQPFTPFKRGPMGIDAKQEAISEESTGWNPNPMARTASEPCNWVRGNLMEGDLAPPVYTAKKPPPQPLPWGNYTIFSFQPRGDTLASHHWNDRQVKGLIDHLGFYGLCEYQASNAFFSYHGPAPLEAGNKTIGSGGEPMAMQAHGVWLYASGDGGADGPKGRLRGTMGSRYVLPAVGNPQLCRALIEVGYQGNRDRIGGNIVKEFMEKTANMPMVMDASPYEWPLIDVQVLRFVVRGGMVTACIITCDDAKNGSHFVIPFTCAGTSLRGARQQRRPHLGWVDDPYREATLDYERVP